MATVLVVDDRAINRDLVRTILGYEGHQVLEADSGRQALRLLERDVPDLMISDVLMPGMDGYELAREVRALPRVREIPIVFYTANYLEREARPIAAACGVEHIVAKDGDPRALIDAVTRALAQRPPGAAAAVPEVPEEDFSREHLRVLNTKLMQKVRELEEKERLSQLVDAAVVVGGDLSLDATLGRIVVTARALVSARYASLQLTDAAGYVVGNARDGEDPPAGVPIGPGASITQSIVTTEGFRGDLTILDGRTGEPFTAADRNLVAGLADAAGSAISNACRYDDSRRRQAWLRASAEITPLLLGSEPAEALPAIVDRAREVAGADVAWIEPATDAVAAPVSGRTSALGASLVRRVRSAGSPVVLADASRGGEGAAGPVADLAGVGPLVAVPMQGRDELLGVLILGNQPHRRGFRPLEVEMAAMFAIQAAMALEFARAQADRERLRIVEERERIARDLHDVVIQRLFAVGLRLDSLAMRLPDPDGEQLTDATAELDHTIDDIREAIFSLRNPGEQPPLRRRLAAIVARAEKTLGFAPSLHVDPELDEITPHELHLHLLATVNEALSNTARHSGAGRADVRVTAEGSELVVVVRDDGRGLPAGHRESGLANLRQRAVAAGGLMTTRPAGEGGGLELTWRVPLPA